MAGVQSIPGQLMVYVAQGSLMVLCNALVALAIVRTPKLRCKEYYVIAALATADALSGLSFASAGVYRSALFYRGTQATLVTPVSCLLVPHAPLLIISQPLASLLLVCINIDRLVAMAAPRRYFKLSTIYSRNLIGAFVVFSLASSLAMIISSFVAGGLHATTAAICSGSCAVHSELGKKYYYGVRVAAGMASVALYILVPFAYQRTKKSMKNFAANRAIEVKTQRKLMVTIGMSTMCTFVFYVLPNVYRSFLVTITEHGLIDQALIEWGAIIQNFNCMFNIFLYYTRHKEIRKGILALFGYKPKMNNSIAVEHSVLGRNRQLPFVVKPKVIGNQLEVG